MLSNFALNCKLRHYTKDAELVDFFQNAPIALHWLSATVGRCRFQAG